MTNITQPLAIIPTLADLEMLACADAKPRHFLPQISYRIGLGWRLLQDENNADRFCRACADSALDVSARARTAGSKLGTRAKLFLGTLLKIRRKWSHGIGHTSTGPTWRRNRRTLF